MRAVTLLLLCLLPLTSPAASSADFRLEHMTWQEVADAIHSGKTTVIVPTGGTEQNGPHMALGKHNSIVQYTATEIALRLKNALIAPVIAYVPEGNISPPEGHMKFAGTLSIPEEQFAALLESTARSLKQHGFTLICFLGDSGGNQKAQAEVAEKLSEEWQEEGVKVLHLADYYDGTKNGQDAWLKSQGFSEVDINAHASIADTSELMAIDSSLIRKDKLGKRTAADYDATGATGDSSKASAAIGKKLLNLKIEAAIEQIRYAEGLSASSH